MTDSAKPAKISRRRMGRGAVLLGASAAGAAVVSTSGAASAAPPTTTWKLGGNTGVNGSNYLGTNNEAALIFKTAATNGNPVERLRIRPTGQTVFTENMGVGTPPFANNRLTAITPSNTGTGILGQSPNSLGSALNAFGVRGLGTVGVQGNGEYMGVQGTSLNYGVFGFTAPDTGGFGVYGRGGTGVKGRSYAGNAVLGDTDTGVGVKGEAYSAGSNVKAIFGEAHGSNSNGVVGQSDVGASAYGVWGISAAGYAGVFSGKALVTGNLAKGGGSFKIDHPLDPENKYLYHSFIESPDMMNVYNGNVRTNGVGRATVQMPDYFEELNRDFRYQLTVLGGDFAQAVISKEIAGRRFQIRTDKPNVKVSWQVTGIRKDPYANANRIPVSEDKPADERGRYLHPEAYGKSATRSIQHERLAAGRARRTDRQPDPVPR